MNTVTRFDLARRRGDPRRSVADAAPTIPTVAQARATVPPEFIALGRRVIFVNRFFDPDISATSQVLTDLARRLAEQGVDVHVVCSRLLYEGTAPALPAYEELQRVKVHRIWTTRYGRAFLPGRALDYASFYPAAMLQLRKLVRSGDIVVAKTDPPLLSVAIAPLVRRRGANLVNWLQDVFPEVAGGLRSGWLSTLLLKPLMRLRDGSLRGARMNVVLGSGMHDYLRDRNVPEARLRIVENWAVGEPIRPIPVQASALRRSLGVGDRLVVGYSGNLGLAHDYETILAAAELLRGDAGIVFLMVGGGSGMRKLKAAAHGRGLENLRFLPYQPRERLADSLAAADVHLVTLLPSVESYMVPSKLYGAMAVGRPVIFVGQSTGEVARAIARAGCGCNVPAGDGLRLASELQRMHDDPALRARLGLNAAAAYDANYTFESAAGRWIDLLQWVVA